jgi:hypothetical protein
MEREERRRERRRWRGGRRRNDDAVDDGTEHVVTMALVAERLQGPRHDGGRRRGRRAAVGARRGGHIRARTLRTW